MQASADAPIHERPEETASESKRRRVEITESNSHPESMIDKQQNSTGVEDPDLDKKSREFVDWTSQKHGPKFLQLSKETQHWISEITPQFRTSRGDEAEAVL